MKQNLHIARITCEHLLEPISLDMRQPRFSWTAGFGDIGHAASSDCRAAASGDNISAASGSLCGVQAAYQIQVADSADREWTNQVLDRKSVV